MRLTDEKLKVELRRQTARSTSRKAECLTQEELTRAAMGELNGTERLTLARHMASCADCSDEYRTLISLKPWTKEVADTLAAAASSASTTKQVHPFIREVHRTDSGPRSRALFSVRAFPRAFIAIAAALLILSVLFVWLLIERGQNNQEIARLNEQLARRETDLEAAEKDLDQARNRLDETGSATDEAKHPDGPGEEAASRGREVERLRSTVQELSSPHLDIPIIDLDPASVRGGPSERVKRVEVPYDAGFLTLILNFPGISHPEYDVEIVNQRGGTIWRGRKASSDAARSLNVTLSRLSVPGGRYLIKLYGVTNGSKEPAAEYDVIINYR